ncbi:YndM family protein [Ornithinibacillus sp. 179-J 7C1 HS]|uniref:YndM family protein n=1 Tax=Ornithinibacillus sp. 179-J 7C1 HS TaxID=3142384 RepID=UPI0039A07FCD
MNVKALGIKFIINLIVVYSIFGIFYNASLVNLFIISVLTTVIAYVVGDLFILRRFGNIVASIADFFLAFVTLAVLGGLIIQTDMPIVLASLFAAFFLVLTEPLLHAYMQEKGPDEKKDRHLASGNLQTEFAEETTPNPLTRKKDKRRDPTK